jgi:phage protein U
MSDEPLRDLSQSLGIQKDNLEMLKQLFPDIFSEGKIDMEKFNEMMGEIELLKLIQGAENSKVQFKVGLSKKSSEDIAAEIVAMSNHEL